MPLMVKILNGREHVMSVEKAAEKLRFFGLRCERIEDLRCPYEIAWPFRMGARDRLGDQIVEVKGTYRALRALQEAA